MKGLMVRGAVRHGPSLLAGLLRCGHCGRRLHVQYSGAGRAVARYVCVGAQLTAGADRCISFGGLRVDEAIEREIGRVLTPGAIEAACTRATQVADASSAARRAVELELREARYEAERARRQYDAVEPEHRLVAETLEARWNDALARVQALERRLATAPEPPAAPPDRTALLALAQDFPAVWADPATDIRAKKRLVRLLLEEIVARVPEPTVVELVLHWAGGKHTVLRLPRNLSGRHRHCTSREVIDVVRDLARICPDQHIGRILNRLGYRTGAGNTWTQARVTSLRGAHGIPAFRADPALVTMDQAAIALGVSAMTVRRLIAKGLLPAHQPVPYAPWTIRREDLFTERVQALAETVKRGGTLPRTASGAQLSLVDSTT
jgi:excisionase family DNA binding protein